MIADELRYMKTRLYLQRTVGLSIRILGGMCPIVHLVLKSYTDPGDLFVIHMQNQISKWITSVIANFM